MNPAQRTYRVTLEARVALALHVDVPAGSKDEAIVEAMDLYRALADGFRPAAVQLAGVPAEAVVESFDAESHIRYVSALDAEAATDGPDELPEPVEPPEAGAPEAPASALPVAAPVAAQAPRQPLEAFEVRYFTDPDAVSASHSVTAQDQTHAFSLMDHVLDERFQWPVSRAIDLQTNQVVGSARRRRGGLGYIAYTVGGHPVGEAYWLSKEDRRATALKLLARPGIHRVVLLDMDANGQMCQTREFSK